MISLDRLACHAYGAHARRSPRTATRATEVQHEDNRNALDGKVLHKTRVLVVAPSANCHISRSWTKVAQLAREKIKRLDDARSLIRQLFRTEVDLVPDQQNKTLTVRLHPMSTEAHDEIVRHICAEITATETVFPGTDLRLIYEISGSC
jgi:hypothetical protein